MAFQRSDQQSGSRYSKGGLSEIKGVRIGWWERKVFQTSSTDVEYILSARYHLRPDLLASDLYGRDSLMWVILQYNSIVDIHTEFIEGSKLILPSRARLLNELLSAST